MTATAVSPRSGALRVALIPHASVLSDAVLVAAGVALIAASAQVSLPLPFTPVPLTGQTFAVVLVGTCCGSVRGFLTAQLYLLLGATGVPIYAHGTAGWSVLSGPTGGYLIGFRARGRRRKGCSRSVVGVAASPRPSERC